MRKRHPVTAMEALYISNKDQFTVSYLKHYWYFSYSAKQ